MTKKIYITGCARSGTTLLARMFHAFDDCYNIDEEVNLYDFVKLCERSNRKFIVGKRTEFSIFSNILSENDIESNLKLIEDNDIIIINCIRDGRFVVDSWVNAWRLYNPFAWLNSIKQSLDHKDIIQLTVKYEDLVNNPKLVEQNIISLLNIKTVHSFDNYPIFVPKNSFKTEDQNYILRELEKIDEDIVPPLTYAQSPNDIELFESYLKILDYE